MKKCPKCGTVMDDSKVKCYMCGTDLQRQTLTNFGNSFNENVGATVSNNQGSVFGNNQFQTRNINQVNGSFSTGSNFSNSLYNNQLNNLNSMAYDDRTALEKMFSSDDRFKSKAEINAEKAMKENQKRNNFADLFNSSVEAKNNQKPNNNPANPGNVPTGQPFGQNPQMMQRPGQPGMPMSNNNNVKPKKDKKPKISLKDKLKKNKNPVQPVSQMPMPKPLPVGGNQPAPAPVNQNPTLATPQKAANPVPQQQQQPPKKESKPPINWGNDLVNANNQDNFKKGGGFKINSSLIFNIVALLISIAGVLFVYFKFIKTDENGKVQTLNGLKYSIANNFNLKDEKSNFRLYTYGEYCTISITYGATNDVSSYVDDFYQQIKDDYEQKNFTVNKNIAKYNDNVWTEINVMNLSNNAASANGYTAQTKIQFVAIVYEGNYYTIAYQNTNNNTICSASYDTFLKSLAFK